MTWLADREIEILDDMVKWVVTYPLVLPDLLDLLDLLGLHDLQVCSIVSTLSCGNVVTFY